jgi:hypothetical protein
MLFFHGYMEFSLNKIHETAEDSKKKIQFLKLYFKTIYSSLPFVSFFIPVPSLVSFSSFFLLSFYGLYAQDILYNSQ